MTTKNNFTISTPDRARRLPGSGKIRRRKPEDDDRTAGTDLQRDGGRRPCHRRLLLRPQERHLDLGQEGDRDGVQRAQVVVNGAWVLPQAVLGGHQVLPGACLLL